MLALARHLGAGADHPIGVVVDAHFAEDVAQGKAGTVRVIADRSRDRARVAIDQTEALTFADQVLVMNEGTVVQAGTPVELFERPRHTFVGHFIGSPGMNVLPCEMQGGVARFAGHPVAAANASKAKGNGKRLQLGVRPEFVSLARDGVPVDIVKVLDAGRYRIVEARANGSTIKMLVRESEPVPEAKAHLRFDPAHTQVYEDGWMVT